MWQRPLRIAFAYLIASLSLFTTANGKPHHRTKEIIKDLAPEKPVDETGKKRLTMWGEKWCGSSALLKAGFSGTEITQGLETCCNLHDDCPLGMPPNSQKWNTVNNSEYSLADCQCDTLFHNCLKADGGWSAETIGKLFFNVLAMPCIEIEEGANLDEPSVGKSESGQLDYASEDDENLYGNKGGIGGWWKGGYGKDNIEEQKADSQIKKNKKRKNKKIVQDERPGAKLVKPKPF